MPAKQFPPIDLPFVKDLKTGRCFWHCPPSRGIKKDCEQGILFAAAYLKYNRTHRMAIPLTWIVFEMPEHWDSFCIGFLEHLQRYLDSMAAQQSDEAIDRFSIECVDHNNEPFNSAKGKHG